MARRWLSATSIDGGSDCPGHGLEDSRNQLRTPDRLERQVTLISDHEEAMGAVAPELLDKSKFPIEIGLHRLGIDGGAFIRTPIAM